MKKKHGSLKVLLAGTAWRVLGSDRAAATLLEVMSGDDEQQRMIAGMSLVKAGERSIDLIQETLSSDRATPPIIRLLADLGGPRAHSVLKEVASGESSELAEAAKQCLDLLSRIDKVRVEEPQHK